MPGQQGGVVDDAVVLWEVNHVHGDELGAEGKDIEISSHGLVLAEDVWEGLSLPPPPLHLEHVHPILRSYLGWEGRNRLYTSFPGYTGRT